MHLLYHKPTNQCPTSSWVYKSPNRSVLSFALDILDLMQRSINVADMLVLTGGINIRINDINCPETNTFLDLLKCLGLTNHIRFATHESASTIDLVITPKGTDYIRDPWQGRLFSDHHIVVFNVITTKGSSSIKETTYVLCSKLQPDSLGCSGYPFPNKAQMHN